MIKGRGKMWKGRGMIKERGCREDVEGKRDDKGKGGCEGKGMIKGRGCREDVEGKGDGQAMVVCCCPVLALRVIVLSVLASHVVTLALCVLVTLFSHVVVCCHRLIMWLCCGVVILSSCVLVLSVSMVGWEEGGKGVLTVLF